MPLKNLDSLKKRLSLAAKEKDSAKRGVKVAAVISESLRTINQNSVLVGGAAVEFYTAGEYTTGDIDMTAFGGQELWALMKELGFEKRGKDYIHPKLKIYIEFPSASLRRGELSDSLDIDGMQVDIVSIEDLLIDRLCSYKFWNYGQDGLAALLLMESGPLDEKRLKKRAKEENVLDALNYLQNVYEEIVRKNLSKKDASLKLQGWLQQKNK